MRTTFLAIMMIFSFSTLSARAAFLPPTAPQNNPSLICHNSNMETPESKLLVEVAEGTEENPFPFVTVKFVNTEASPEVLFARTVNETRGANSTQFFAPGIEMNVSADAQGVVTGNLHVESEQKGTQEYNLNCQVMYYAMPVKPAL